MIAEGLLWSTVVIISHRSTGMLSQSQLMLLDRRDDWQLEQSQAILTISDHFPGTRQAIWNLGRVMLKKLLEFVNGLMKQTGFRGYLPSSWKPFPLVGFVFQAKEQIRWGGLQTTWTNQNLTCNAKNKQETFFPQSRKKLKKEKHVSEATGYKQKSKTNREPAWAEPCKGSNGGITVTMHRSFRRGRERQLPTRWGLRGRLGKNKQEQTLKQVLCLLFQWR